MKQLELSKKTGLTQQYISQLENNSRTKSPTLHTIYILAEALDICPYELIEYICPQNCSKINDCPFKKFYNKQ